ncbi:MAG: hypothetical protein HYY22_08025 [Thaumarchaeota archaeon]|nr:hypothetical protein [Nitrososphaerota archaeon]
MTERSEDVHIKLKRGAWEIEITCPADKISQAVESVLSGLNTATPETTVAATTSIAAEKAAGKRGITCRSLIETLWNEGWFKEERNLSDVHQELARRGYHYDPTAVSHSLTDLVRENVLTRVGMMRNYRYIQKRPPQ